MWNQPEEDPSKGRAATTTETRIGPGSLRTPTHRSLTRDKKVSRPSDAAAAAAVTDISGADGRDRRKWRSSGARDKKVQGRFLVIHAANKTWECIGEFLQRRATGESPLNKTASHPVGGTSSVVTLARAGRGRSASPTE